MGQVPVSVGAVSAELLRVQGYLSNLATTEGRLAVSLAIAAATAVIAAVLAPRLVRTTTATVVDRLPEDGAAQSIYEATGYLPTTVGAVVVRSIQAVLLLAAVLALLVVWGATDRAVALLAYVSRSLPVVGRLGTTVLVFLSAYVALGLLDDGIERFSEGADRVTEHQEEIVRRLGHLAILAMAIATTMTIWGVDLSGLLVGAGFLGIVVGLAARQTLGSLLAGFVLMFSRPFTIGDWVAVGDQEGIVTDITIMNTRLENFDGEFVVIPNDEVANSAITNRSRKGHLRVRVDVGVDYDADVDRAREVARETIEDVEAVSTSPPPQVVPKRFGDSAIVLELRFWIDRPTPPRKWQATSAVVTAVKDAFERAGITIPFPQRELSGRAETGGLRVQGDGARGTAEADPSADGGRKQ